MILALANMTNQHGVGDDGGDNNGGDDDGDDGGDGDDGDDGEDAEADDAVGDADDDGGDDDLHSRHTLGPLSPGSFPKRVLLLHKGSGTEQAPEVLLPHGPELKTSKGFGFRVSDSLRFAKP